MSEEMMSPDALRALELSGSQLHIVLAALETKDNVQTIEALNDIAIKMCDAHRRRPDPSETFMTAEPNEAPETEEGSPSDDPSEGGKETETEWADENGEAFLLRPKRAAEARNAPGAAATSTKGAIHQFNGIPSSHPKGAGQVECCVYALANMATFGANVQNLFAKYFQVRPKEKVLGKRALRKVTPLENERTPIYPEMKNGLNGMGGHSNSH